MLGIWPPKFKAASLYRRGSEFYSAFSVERLLGPQIYSARTVDRVDGNRSWRRNAQGTVSAGTSLLALDTEQES